MKLVAATAVATVSALVLIGCQVFQIGAVIDRTADLEGDALTLTGEVTCSEPEPIDLFPTVIQDGQRVTLNELTTSCEGRSRFTEVFGLPHGHSLHPGVADLRVVAITNPAEFEHEDRVVIERQVILYSQG